MQCLICVAKSKLNATERLENEIKQSVAADWNGVQVCLLL